MDYEGNMEKRIAAFSTEDRVTPERLDDVIVSRQFLRPYGTTLTLCVLTLRNGFNVVGESACVDPANFKQDIGEDIAFRNAREKIWLLEGYALAERRLNSRDSSGPEQADEAMVAQDTCSAQLGAGGPYTDPTYARMRALECASSLIASGNVPGDDPVNLAQKLANFIEGK